MPFCPLRGSFTEQEVFFFFLNVDEIQRIHFFFLMDYDFGVRSKNSSTKSWVPISPMPSSLGFLLYT